MDIGNSLMEGWFIKVLVSLAGYKTGCLHRWNPFKALKQMLGMLAPLYILEISFKAWKGLRNGKELYYVSVGDITILQVHDRLF